MSGSPTTSTHAEECAALSQSIHDRIYAMSGTLDPNAITQHRKYPDIYKEAMLWALSRSHVMARWMMLDDARAAQDLTRLRVYDRFLTSPEVFHKVIDLTVELITLTSDENPADYVAVEHFQRCWDIREMLDEPAVKIRDDTRRFIMAVYVTGSEELRCYITAHVEAVCDLVKKRSPSSPEDTESIITPLIGGSIALNDGAL